VWIFICLVILPVIVYLDVLNLNHYSSINANPFLTRLKKITIYLVILGVFIVFLMIIAFFLKSISYQKLGILILIEALYISYLITSASTEVFEINVGKVYLKIDISVLNLFIIPVPIIAIFRTIVKFVYERRDILSKLIILKALIGCDGTSISQIRKSILKNQEIKLHLKTNVLKNFKETIRSLEIHPPYPLIAKNNKSKYRVTKTGKEFLSYFGYDIYNDEKQIQTLQVWTESDLTKLARKRGIKLEN